MLFCSKVWWEKKNCNGKRALQTAAAVADATEASTAAAEAAAAATTQVSPALSLKPLKPLTLKLKPPPIKKAGATLSKLLPLLQELSSPLPLLQKPPSPLPPLCLRYRGCRPLNRRKAPLLLLLKLLYCC